MSSTDDYSTELSGIFRYGNPHDKKVGKGKTKGGIVLMGGGLDVVEAFEWQTRNAGGGDFVILRTAGTDAYNPWIWNMSIRISSPLNSVTTLRMMTREDSYNSTYLTIIRNAEAIFFAGGDQSTYIRQWANTPVQTTIQSLLQNTTVGGTSAGLAIMGAYIYTAEDPLPSDADMTSKVAMALPNSEHITLASSPFLKIPLLSSVLTDTHFVTRNRMGRMLTFLARQGSSPIRGIGVDEQTAILLNTTTGRGLLVGLSTAYVCAPTIPPCYTPEAPTLCSPLTFEKISCTRFYAGANDSIDFNTFGAGRGATFQNNIIRGRFSVDCPLQYGPLPNPSPVSPCDESPSSSPPSLMSQVSIGIFVAVLIAVVLCGVLARLLYTFKMRPDEPHQHQEEERLHKSERSTQLVPPHTHIPRL